MLDRDRKIIDLYTAPLVDGRRLTMAEVAETFGIGRDRVWQILHRYGVRGVKGPRKITPAMRAEVVRQYTARLPDGTWKGSKLIAADLGMSDVSVLDILHNTGVVVRGAKEAHAHGKRCGPFKHMAQFEEPPVCVCGCGTPVQWVRSAYKWAKYALGHYRPDKPYKNEQWLLEQYEVQRRTLANIAEECGVELTSVVNYMKVFGIARRDARESHKGTQAGERNPAWKGGTTPERQKLYKTEEWKEFLKEVYKRDNYTCQHCKRRTTGGTSMRSSVAHHIKSFSVYPALRMEPSNLVTLCRECHLWVHSLENINQDFIG